MHVHSSKRCTVDMTFCVKNLLVIHRVKKLKYKYFNDLIPRLSMYCECMIAILRFIGRTGKNRGTPLSHIRIFVSNCTAVCGKSAGQRLVVMREMKLVQCL